MRRPMAILLASSMGFAAPAFAQSSPSVAQSVPPVLIGQEAPQAVGQADPAAGQDALAQDPNTGLFGPGGASPLLIVGGLVIGGGLIIYAATKSQSVSP